MVGALVPSTEGWVRVTYIRKYRSRNRKYKIVTNVGTVVYDEKQHFFQNSKRTNCIRFFTGDNITTLYGEEKILKRVSVPRYGEVYVDIATQNYNSNFYTHFGILTCR